MHSSSRGGGSSAYMNGPPTQSHHYRRSSEEYSQRRHAPSTSPSASSNAVEEGDFVWINEPGAVYTPAVVVRSGFVYDEDTEHEQQVTVVHTEDGEEREIRPQPKQSLVKLPPSHHPKQLPSLQLHDLSNLPLMATNGDVGRNEVFTKEQLENVVLYTLRARYRMEQIYTWVDRVLVSINPVSALPIYTPDHMQEYNKSREQTPFYEKDVAAVNEAPPHVFAIAQNAIRCMQDAAEDQAVILLGGMGAGKSEAAKLIVQYLCEIGESAVRPEVAGSLLADSSGESGVLHPIGQQILHAFTILEAFGNASTSQNRNSSRFAKMISVEFSKHGYVIGGGFTTHYFEKSRVISCHNHERNFHVFYQVLAGVQHDPTLRDAMDLNRTVAEFELLKQADPAMIDPALDARDYRDLMSSFSALRIRKNQRIEIVRIIAALLHLGNVDFVPETDNKSSSSGTTSDSPSCALKDPSQIVLAAKLLEVEPVVLDNYFRTRQFFSKDGNKTVSSLKVVTVSQARRARDTFIRSLYEALFNFLVETLNGILGGIFDRYEKSNIVVNSQGVHVLDILGFECLDSSSNGFDQLCFNYWSEKVHSFYVHNTLAINFADLDDEPQHVENRLTAHGNVDIANGLEECLSLFENKPFGIFEQLNENSKVRSPNDEDLIAKILAGNEGVPALSRPNMGNEMTNEYLAPSKDWRLLFVVKHYCGKVTYNGKGLSAKNTLTISATCAAIMQSSKNAVLHAVGAAQVAAASNEKAAKQAAARGATGSKFRNSMSSAKDMKNVNSSDSAATDVLNQADALLHALNHTGKNFLVCMKPNEDLEDGVFDSEYVMKQIRENHLVELIKASRTIFTVHLTYNHFFRRYKNICGHRGTLESLLRSLSAIGVLEEEKFVVGRVKVYLTSHQWKKLEKARYLYLNACATMIQRNMLRGVFRKNSSRLLQIMRGLRKAMQRRDTDNIIQHLAICTRIIGKKASEDIRILIEGNAMILRLDAEEYVKSIIADVTKIGHPVLLEYAIQVAERCCPSVKVDHLKAHRKVNPAAQRRMAENAAIVNQKLRESIIDNDPESLMGVLATLEAPSVESIERKLATMMIIRSLEEKTVVEELSHRAKSMSAEKDPVKLVSGLLAPMKKAIELGLEAKFPQLESVFNKVINSAPDLSPTNESPIPLVDPTPLLAALEKAQEEENIVAIEKVLHRLHALNVRSNDIMKIAEKKVQNQSSTISSHLERKQMVKFLNIAKLSQDLQLMNEAIEAAISTGLAKWDFNLKNAERERDKLLAAAAATESSNGTYVSSSAGNHSPKQHTDPIASYLWKIWTSFDMNELSSLSAMVPSELTSVVATKLARLEQVTKAKENLHLAKTSDDVQLIENALSISISIGYSSSLFEDLLNRHSMLTKKIGSNEAELDGLHATIKFLSHRIETNAELRADALDLLSSQIEEYSRENNSDDKEKVLMEAGRLRRTLEACMAATSRLESVLALPAGEVSVSTLEVHLKAARKAGVCERLLLKAEEKILATRNGEQSDGAAIESETASLPPGNPQLERIQSDINDWMGGDDDGSDTNDRRSRALDEKDASAFNHFENLRSFNAQSEKTKRLSWEGRALSQSLSVLDDPAFARVALSINRCILGYMRDRIVFYREMLAHYILQIGLVKASLVDEIYLQLMKQLTKNPKRDSSIRGWSLFAMCATSFPPSLALQNYVLRFLRAQTTASNSFWRLVRSFAAYSLKKLENLIEHGASGFIPSIEEIRGYEARPPFLATIELLDGTPLADSFPITPEMNVEHLIEICSHFLGLEDHVVNFLGLTVISEKVTSSSSVRHNSAGTLPHTSSFVSTTSLSVDPNSGDDLNSDASIVSSSVSSSAPTSSSSTSPSSSATSYFHKFLSAPSFLNAKVFLGDIFEKELIRGREIRFVLKIRLNPVYMLQYHDEMYDRLVYIQVLDEIVKGNLPLLEEESVLRLAAVAMAVDGGDEPPQTAEELVEMNIMDYIPLEWQTVHDEDEWATLVLETMLDNLLDEDGLTLPVGELQRIYIEEVTRHRLYGAVFFPCKLLHRNGSSKSGNGNNGACLGIELPNYFVVAVNGYGVHFVGRDGALLAFCDYGDILFCGGSYHQYKIVLKKAADVMAATEEIVVTTKYSDELTAIITDYKEITALLNEV